MLYFTWKPELVSNILWMVVGNELHNNWFDIWPAVYSMSMKDAEKSLEHSTLKIRLFGQTG